MICVSPPYPGAPRRPCTWNKAHLCPYLGALPTPVLASSPCWDRQPWFWFCIEVVELDWKLPAFLGHLPWCYTAVGWGGCHQKTLLFFVTITLLVLGIPFVQGVGGKVDKTGKELKMNNPMLSAWTAFSHQLWCWGYLPFTQAETRGMVSALSDLGPLFVSTFCNDPSLVKWNLYSMFIIFFSQDKALIQKQFIK